MPLSVQQILEQDGPGLSTRVVRRLEAHGMSAESARQRVSRADGKVHRLAGLVFPRGARFLYLESAYNSERYWDALTRDIDEAGPAYSPAIAAIAARDGIIRERDFDVVSGSPVRQKGQIASVTVLERLLAIRILDRFEMPGIGACLRLTAGGYFPTSSDETFRARLLTDRILLLAVKQWARTLGLASYNKIALRDDSSGAPMVGTFRWDMAGPSYLRAVLGRGPESKKKPGFLVCDVVSGGFLGERSMNAFVRKCRLLSQLRRIAPFMPLLVADRFTHEAFKAGRGEGILMATPKTLFGREVAEGLATLLQTMSKAAAVAVSRPEIVGELMSKLSRIEGAAANLRGALFEMLVAYCVRWADDGSVDIGKTVVGADGASAEIDVLRVKEYREVWAYECKAHQPSEVISADKIDRWIENRVPLIYAVLRRQERFQHADFHFEYWTCGKFGDDALAKLQAVAAATSRYTIGWKDGAAVRAYAGQIHPKAILDTLDQHFFRHPLAQIDKEYDLAGALHDFDLDLPTETEDLGPQMKGPA